MIKKRVLHFVITLASIIVSTALLLLPEPPAVYVAWVCPVLFFSVITGICCGFLPALLTGALPPFLAFLVQNFALPTDVSFYVPMAVYAVSGITAAMIYRALTTSIGASASAVLAGRFVLGTANLIIYYLRGQTYTIRMFLHDGFVSVFSGLILVLVMIPVLILLFRRRGIMKLLRSEKMVYGP